MRRGALFLPTGVKREAAGVALGPGMSAKPGKTKGSVVVSGRGRKREDDTPRTKPATGTRRKKRRSADAQAKISRRRNRAR